MAASNGPSTSTMLKVLGCVTGVVGALLVYGPVFLPDEPRAEGNVAVDREMREQDPAYGVRTLEQLDALLQ